MPALIIDGRNGQRNVGQAPVFSALYRLVTNDALASADSFDNCQLFIGALRREKNSDRFADNFTSAVAKEPFRFFVPTGDPPIEIDAYDRVTGGLNDRSQPAVSVFDAFLLGDVAQIRRKNWRPIDVGCADGKRHQNLGTIPAQGRDFDQPSEQRAFASFQIVSQALSMSLAKSRGNNQTGQHFPNNLITPKSEYTLGRRVEFPHASSRVHRDNAIERRIEESATESLQRCSWTPYFISLVLLRWHLGPRLQGRRGWAHTSAAHRNCVNVAPPVASASMFGVLMSVQPLNPTSFQPRSSATIWTKLGLFSAAFARATAPNSASTLVSAAAMRFCLGLTFILVSFLCLSGSVISLRCGCWKQNLLPFQGAAPWTEK